VSAIVCAVLFLRPAMAKMLGEPPYQPTMLKARLTAPLKANDARQDYIRAKLSRRDGELVVEPFPVQDSSMQRALAEADALIVRAPGAPAADAGHMADVMALDDC
jgi:molybdopterin molybdotransferase